MPGEESCVSASSCAMNAASGTRQKADGQAGMSAARLSCEHKGSPTRRLVKAELVDLGAAALNENDENHGKQNAGNYADQNYAVHFKNPFRGWL